MRRIYFALTFRQNNREIRRAGGVWDWMLQQTPVADVRGSPLAMFFPEPRRVVMPLLEEEKLDRAALTRLQEARLRSLLKDILPQNRFYADKLSRAGLSADDLQTLEDWQRLPFTSKPELLQDQADHPPYGRFLTYPIAAYTRYHQTSGTTGQPLRWLDTTESWQWVLGCWQKIYTMAGVRPEDRLFFPFSFGPFLGFWSAFEAAGRVGCLCLPGGGLGSTARLRFLQDNGATVVLCTPTYALHLAEVARQQGLPLAHCPVRALIVAGEPGGSIPATRKRIEDAWGGASSIIAV